MNNDQLMQGESLATRVVNEDLPDVAVTGYANAAQKRVKGFIGDGGYFRSAFGNGLGRIVEKL